MRKNIKNLTVSDLKKALSLLGLEDYRVNQVLKWIYQRQVGSFDLMTNIKRGLQEHLSQFFMISRLKVSHTQHSIDGTKKYLIELEDGQKIESVLIPTEKRNTLCVSSQVGCAIDCKFCLTATMGLKRNLSIYEIVDQVGAVLRELNGKERITNLVFMGMGEPLANTKNLYPALEILMHPHAFGFSRQHITVSTSGLAPQIEKFGDHTPVKLAISLNATTDEVRSKIMPVNKRYPLSRLIEACKKMYLHKRNRITFEYVMLHGVNDTVEDARRLTKILSSLKAKINLIPFNPFPGSPYQRPSDEWVRQFQKILLDKGFVANVRTSRGQDILGACGQLATLSQAA